MGALHGPAELFPVSSSGHTTLIPWLAGASYLEIDPELRKALEVALHAGAAAGLLVAWRATLVDELATFDRHDLEQLALASAPAALLGYLFQDRIEVRLGRPAVIAAGLVLGGVGMALADREPELRSANTADLVDAAWLGLAQACALVPGVSRRGATLTAARWRRFQRPSAAQLSRRLAFPVILGATTLKTWRLAQGGLDPTWRATLGVGTAASFASTLLVSRFEREPDAGRALWPFALYRMALAGLTLARMRREASERRVHDQGHGGSA